MKTSSPTVLLVVCVMLTACAGVPPTTSPASVARLEGFYQQWQGTPYRYGGDSRRGLDCSAFVARAYRELYGLSLPRSTRQQAGVGVGVSRRHLQAGDLVFFRTGLRSRHVGIYLAGGRFIHASPSGGVVRSSLGNAYWSRRYWRARRLL